MLPISYLLKKWRFKDYGAYITGEMYSFFYCMVIAFIYVLYSIYKYIKYIIIIGISIFFIALFFSKIKEKFRK